jgi:hypothetical protein
VTKSHTENKFTSVFTLKTFIISWDLPNNLIIDKFHKNILWALVFRPKDFRREYNKEILENAIKDLSPDTKDNDQITGFLGKKE